MQNYRFSTRGQQRCIHPKVGKSGTREENAAIRKALNDAGYFATFISAGQISVSETSNSLIIDDAGIYVEKV